MQRPAEARKGFPGDGKCGGGEAAGALPARQDAGRVSLKVRAVAVLAAYSSLLPRLVCIMFCYVKPDLPGSRQAEAGEAQCKGQGLINAFIRQ
ncbi:hypothetical protein EOM81_08710 [bacterium]|nr:hypothetical protein [bacterium]